MLDPLIGELLALFAEVNIIENADTRLNVWANKSDGILEVYALQGRFSRAEARRTTWRRMAAFPH
jgi:hypothetical protein